MKALFFLVLVPVFTGCMLLPQQGYNQASRKLHSPTSDIDSLEMLLLNDEQPIAAKTSETEEQDQLQIGMPKHHVRRYFGRPSMVEVAGNPVYGNERWTYTTRVSTPEGYYTEEKVIYFEDGQIVGWETH